MTHFHGMWGVDGVYGTEESCGGPVTEAVVRLWAERGFRETHEELAQLMEFALGAV